MKISAINGYSFNNANFEARRRKEVDAPVHKVNPAKAIPLALLIAMSPVNAQVPTGPRTAYVTEQMMQEENETVAQNYVKKATPEGFPARIDVYCPDGSSKKLVVSFPKKISSYAIDKDGNIVDAYRIREITITPEALSCYKSTRNFRDGKEVIEKYYVTGSGTEYTDVPQAADSSVILKDGTRPINSKVEHFRYEISEDLYKMIKNMIGDKIPVDEQVESSYVIHGKKR